MTQTWPWLLVSIATLASPALADTCQFQHSPSFRDEIVIPELRKAVGDQLTDWRFEEPTISVVGNTVRVLIQASDASRLDAPIFVIEVDRCGAGDVRSGLQAWDAALGLRSSTPFGRP
jgi:hypothetical protein